MTPKPPYLFDQIPEAPCNPQPTSQAAHIAARPKKGTLRYKVWALILGTGNTGATDEEMQIRMGISGDTQRPRRYELVEAGFIKDSGRRRKTTNGKEAIVWVIK